MNFLPSALAITLLAAALLSFLLVKIVMNFASTGGMLVHPGRRQSHDLPTLTGGGAGIVSAVIILSLFYQWRLALPQNWMLAVLPGMAVLSIIGWIDDRRHVSSLARLAFQIIVAGWLLVLINQPGEYRLPVWPALWCLVLVGFMNAYNFMDGSDGMAAFQAVFAGLVMTVIFGVSGAVGLALCAALLAGSCAGFLPMNFPRARIFMGDSGSVPIGFCLAALMIMGIERELIGIPEAFLLMAVFLVDSSLTLFTRVIRRERWYTAHKQHVYQRLIAHGWSHSRVLLIYQAINIVLMVPALMLARMYPDLAWIVAGLMFLLLSTGWYLASLRLGVRD